MKSTFWFLILAVLLASPAVSNAGGTVEDVNFFSEALGHDQAVRVYLPEGYDPEDDVGYPVVYFLHGAVYSYPIYWSAFGLQATLDDLIGSGEIHPLIFVTPDGTAEPWWGSYWVNSELYGNFEDFVVDDLVDYVDNNYATIDQPAFRSIHGLSMGGYGVMSIALRHPHQYRAVASHAGVLDLEMDIERLALGVQAEYPGPPYEFDPDAGTNSKFLFTKAGSFSPNMDNPPYFVDLPIDQYANPINRVVKEWRKNSPTYLVKKLKKVEWRGEDDEGTGLAIYFDSGFEDYLFTQNESFAAALDRKRIPYDFQTFEGGHSDQFVNRFPIALKWLDSVMFAPPSDDGDEDCGERAEHVRNGTASSVGAISAELGSGGSQLRFDLDQAAEVELIIYDASGRSVRQISVSAAAGSNSVLWDQRSDAGRPVAAGIYFVRLRANQNHSDVEKILVIR